MTVPVANGASPPQPDPRSHAGLLDEIAERVGSRREAGWILEHAQQDTTDPDPSPRALALAERRAAGEPLQYVFGRWPFRIIDLDVDGRVLIPRPETEQVVDVALGRLAGIPAPTGDGAPALRCGDLGTGSGAIALSLAAEIRRDGSRLEVWATDRSEDALLVARANRDRLARSGLLGGAVVELVRGDWFDALPSRLTGAFDLIVSNPPYVGEEEFDGLDPTVRDHEPYDALVAARGARGTPGLADVETVLTGAPKWLRSGGVVVVEIAPHQAPAAREVARSAGLLDVTIQPDLAGRPRMVVASC